MIQHRSSGRRQATRSMAATMTLLVIGLGVSVILVIYGVRTILNSANQGAMIFKSVVFPEWWLYAPFAACFAFLAIEFIRRFVPAR